MRFFIERYRVPNPHWFHPRKVAPMSGEWKRGDPWANTKATQQIPSLLLLNVEPQFMPTLPVLRPEDLIRLGIA